jgi:hypothetical protein
LTLEAENTYIVKLLQTPKPSQWAYSTFIKRIPFRDKSKEKWEDILQTQFTDGDWSDINQRAYQCTIETKARMFQYKIIHRFLATNSYLCKVKIKNSDRCDHCGNGSETLVHLFWECQYYAKQIWIDLRNWLIPVYDISQFFNAQNIILGVKLDTHHRLINHIILVAKWHLYASKYIQCKPVFTTLLKQIKKQYNIEKSIISHNDTLGIGLSRKWAPLLPLLED